jgi:hypothetical protein
MGSSFNKWRRFGLLAKETPLLFVAFLFFAFTDAVVDFWVLLLVWFAIPALLQPAKARLNIIEPVIILFFIKVSPLSCCLQRIHYKT